MSNLYGTSQITSIEEMANSEELQRLFLLDDILGESADFIKEWAESEEGKVLMEKNALDKRVVEGLGRILGKPCPGPAFLADRPPNCSSSNHRRSKAAICSKATDGFHEGCVVCIHCDGRPCRPRTFFGFQRRIFISWD